MSTWSAVKAGLQLSSLRRGMIKGAANLMFMRKFSPKYWKQSLSIWSCSEWYLMIAVLYHGKLCWSNVHQCMSSVLDWFGVVDIVFTPDCVILSEFFIHILACTHWNSWIELLLIVNAAFYTSSKSSEWAVTSYEHNSEQSWVSLQD